MVVNFSVPTGLIQSVIDSYRKRAGRPELPAGTRAEAQSWLRRVLADFDTWEAHDGYLRGGMEPSPGSGTGAPTLASGTQGARGSTLFGSLFLHWKKTWPLRLSARGWTFWTTRASLFCWSIPVPSATWPG